MKKLLALVLAATLVLGLGASAIAVEETEGVSVVVNDAAVVLDVPVQVWDQVSYVSYWPVIKALYPDAAAVWQDGMSVITAAGLEALGARLA